MLFRSLRSATASAGDEEFRDFALVTALLFEYIGKSLLAYNNSSSIPIDELSFTFGIPLTLQLEKNTNNMEAWLLQFQADQKRLTNILKQEHHNQGKITTFLVSRTRGCSPEKPPD